MMNRNDPLCSVCRNEAMVGVILPLLPVRGLRWSWPSFFVRGNDGSERSEGERMKISVRQTKDSPLHNYYNSCA